MLGEMYSASDTTKMRIERADKKARLYSQFESPKQRSGFSVTAILTSVLGILR